MIQKKRAIFLVFLVLAFSLPSLAWAALPPGNTSPKKGVGYADRGTRNQMRALGVSWSYPWYIKAEAFAVPEYGHVPMIWGKDYDANTVAKVAREHPGSYWLIWNEPNLLNQANLSPAQAAQIYRDLRPLIKNIDQTAKLIVGGTAQLNTPWLANFRQNYFNLTGQWPVVEGWHAHYYVGASEVYDKSEWRQKLNGFKNWLLSNGGTVEFWLTEFGCLNCWGAAGEAKMQQVMSEQIPWLENQSWINRYAWFATKTLPSQTGELLNATGLTSLGQLYATFGSPPPPAGGLTPTPTLLPAKSLKLRLKGVTAKPALVANQNLSFQVKIGSQESVLVAGRVDDQGIWRLEFVNSSWPAGAIDVFVKGPKHLRQKFAGVFFNGAVLGELLPGDLPIGTNGAQDGVVNSLDAVYLSSCFAFPQEATCLARADLDLDGTITTLDMELMNATIVSQKWEDE